MVYQKDGLCLVSVYEIDTTGQTLLQAILIQVSFHLLVMHSRYSYTVPVLEYFEFDFSCFEAVKWRHMAYSSDAAGAACKAHDISPIFRGMLRKLPGLEGKKLTMLTITSRKVIRIGTERSFDLAGEAN